MKTEHSPVEIPQEYQDLMATRGFAHVASLGPDGGPHSTPVWYDYDGTHVLFSLTTGRQKYHNLSRRPRVALSIIDPDNPYKYLEVRGVVADIVDDEGNAFIDKMARKYTRHDRYPWHRPGDHRVVVRVAPLETTQMGA
ncbi:MAG: PPOX class F420-dependent oxidoreductase [Actinomycetota bacterium]